MVRAIPAIVRRVGLMVGTCAVIAGCGHTHGTIIAPPDVPREMSKISLPDYHIQPPDVLVVEIIGAVPRPPYKIQPQDTLFVLVRGTPAEDPIKGSYRVEPEGTLRLGPGYGAVRVANMTIEEATNEVEKHLKKTLKTPQVFVSLDESRGTQQVRGEHLVRPDGTISLGIYGRVNVTGKTQEEARAAIEAHLSMFFLNPTISLDVAGFNSSVYYVVFDGGGAGEQVLRLPFTGNETVLDAIGQVNGLPAVASKNRVWLARPDEHGNCGDQVYPINWKAITQCGIATTNYQVFPGDRIYVAAMPLVTTDTFLARLLSPVERVLGVTLLGASTLQQINNVNSRNGGGIGSGF